MGRPNLYDWNEIFDRIASEGSIKLSRGVDYTVSSKSFRGGLLNEARRRDVRLRTASVGFGEALLITLVRQASYPWDRWLDGNEHYLVEGQDFRIAIEDMRSSARRMAKNRGLYLRSETNEARDTLKIQATTTPPPRTRAAKWVTLQEEAMRSGLAEKAREADEFDAYTDSNALESGTFRD